MAESDDRIARQASSRGGWAFLSSSQLLTTAVKRPQRTNACHVGVFPISTTIIHAAIEEGIGLLESATMDTWSSLALLAPELS